MSDAQQVPVIVILGQDVPDTARRVQARYPRAPVHGLAGRVEADRSHMDFGDTLRELYCADHPIVALCTVGIVIRSLVPLLQRKGAEPPILALAEDGSAVVPLLGRLAGANRLAREIGEVLAVAPAITASGKLRFGTCVLNPPTGYVLADLEQDKRFVADLLGGQPVRIEGAAGWPDTARLPCDPAAALTIHVTPPARAPRAEELLIHPRYVLAALEPADAATDTIRQALADTGLVAAALSGLLTNSVRMTNPRLQATADVPGVPLHFLPQADPAARLRQALPAAEQVGDRLAVAAAPLAMDHIGQRRGQLTVIGLGPGYTEPMVPVARRALDEAEDILGYQTYVDMTGPFHAGQMLHGSDNREELQRAWHAFELAATGRAVVLISSGNPGVFAMTVAVLEALHGAGEPAWDVAELRVFPDVSAALAIAARAGAPLGHDFCLLSLSDNLKPWEVIERRLDLAGAADLAMAFCNPISRAQPWQLGRALEIVARHRSPQTLVVLGRDIGRPNERLLRTTLGELRAKQVGMRILVIIDSSITHSFSCTDGETWVYTPRWYPSEQQGGDARGNVADCCAHPCTTEPESISFRCSPCRLAGILLVVLFVLGLAAAAGSCKRLAATGNPEYPPYLWRDPQDPKRLIGANADLLQRLGKELGVRIDTLYSGSWEKVQEEVTSGRADLLAGAYLTLARLGSMNYVYPPFLVTSGVVWVNKDAAFPFIGCDDLIGHKDSVLTGSSLGEEFDRFVRASLDLKPMPSLIQGLQDLMLKHSEFLLYQALPGQAQVEALGMANDLEALEPVLSSEGLYLTLPHSSACNDPWLRGQLVKKTTELSAAGVPVTFLQGSLECWKAQQLPASGASSAMQESDLRAFDG